MFKSILFGKLATKKLWTNFRRLSHTDLKVPDFNASRRESVKDPKKSKNNNEDRKAFSYLIIGGNHI